MRLSIKQEGSGAGAWLAGPGRGVQENFFSLGNSQLEKVGDAAVAIDSVCVKWRQEAGAGVNRGSGRAGKGCGRGVGGRGIQANCCQYVCNANKLYLIKGTRVTDTPRLLRPRPMS